MAERTMKTTNQALPSMARDIHGRPGTSSATAAARFFCLATLGWPLLTAQGWQVTGLYNTGVDDSGNVLPVTSPDPHYSVTFYTDTGAAYVRPVVFHFGDPNWQAWVTPPAGSAWVGPTATTDIYPYDAPGWYVYTLRWWLDPGGWDPSQFRLSGFWASDNTSTIYLNGQATGHWRDDWGFVSLQYFELDGLVAGENTLEFHVNNGWGPTGLLVTGLQVSGPMGPVLPDSGSTLPFLAAALALIGGLRRQTPPRAACT